MNLLYYTVFLCFSMSPVTLALNCLLHLKSSAPYQNVTSQLCQKQYTHQLPLAHPHGNTTHVAVNVSLSKDDTDIDHCMMFKYTHNKYVSFSCDFSHECQHKKTNIGILTTVNGEKGLLYCCTTDDCNNVEKANQLHFKQSTCIKGNSSTQGPETHIESVECYGQLCVSQQRVWSKQIMYSCDEHDMCDKHKIPHNGCKEVDSVGHVCCCEGKNCNHKLTPLVPVTPLAPMPSDLPSNPLRAGSTELNWMLVGALIGALIVSFLVLIATIVLIRHCRHQRELSHQRAYSYQQLTADFATDESEGGDDKLIIA